MRQSSHSVHLISHQKLRRILKKKREERSKKKSFHNLNEYFEVVPTKDHGNVKYQFCNKIGHLRKDCMKRKA